MNRDRSAWRIGDKVRVTPHVGDPGGQVGYVTGFDGGNPKDGYEVELDNCTRAAKGRRGAEMSESGVRLWRETSFERFAFGFKAPTEAVDGPD
jgi:hypothetical protein